ncbi:hypothetical protein CCYA_CCYA10G2961 [Cyanidiococcus yangmingshanensis]|nr:hypothetical protein CCYA_CCYA10G2961 [Cyanidiococcus yangmingshanensis]
MGKVGSEGEQRVRSTQSLRSAEGRRKVLRWLQASGWWHSVREQWNQTSIQESQRRIVEQASKLLCELNDQERNSETEGTRVGTHSAIEPSAEGLGFGESNAVTRTSEVILDPKLPAHIVSILSRTAEELDRRRKWDQSREIREQDKGEVATGVSGHFCDRISNSQAAGSATTDIPNFVHKGREKILEATPLLRGSKDMGREDIQASDQEIRPQLSTPAQPRRRLTGAQRRRFDRKCEATQQRFLFQASQSRLESELGNKSLAAADASAKTPTVSPLSGDRTSPMKLKRSSKRAATVFAKPNLSTRRRWASVTPAQRRLCFESSSERESVHHTENEDTVTEDSSVDSGGETFESTTHGSLSMHRTPASLQSAYEASVKLTPKGSRTFQGPKSAVQSPEPAAKRKRGENREQSRIPKRARGKRQEALRNEESEHWLQSTDASKRSSQSQLKARSPSGAKKGNAVRETTKRKNTQEWKSAKDLDGAVATEMRLSTASSRPSAGNRVPEIDTQQSGHPDYDPNYWQAQRERASARRAVYYSARYWSQANMAAYVARLHPMQARLAPHLGASSIMIPSIAPQSVFVPTRTSVASHPPSIDPYRPDLMASMQYPNAVGPASARTPHPGFAAGAGMDQNASTETESTGSI